VGEEWRDCMVTLYDLVGVKKLAPESGAGSALMRRLHGTVAEALTDDLPTVHRAYCWNDSVLLLSYLGAGKGAPADVLRDADRLKKRIDHIANSYAVAVRGQAFPPPPGAPPPPRVNILEASSYAMANCLVIEKELKHLKKAWYIDGRLARHIRTSQRASRHSVALLPSGKSRSVYVYDGYLWSDGEL